MSWTAAAQIAAQVAGVAASAIDMYGFIETECVCRVVGSPRSVKRNLHFLAAAICFGKCPRLGPLNLFVPPPGLIMLNEDVTGREIEFTIQYRNSTAVAMTMAGIRGMTPTDMYNQLEILSGPKETVYGRPWNFVGPGIGVVGAPGDPAFRVPMSSALVPELPWNNKTLLTTNDKVVDPDPLKPAPGGFGLIPPLIGDVIDSPNPRPYGDYRSRGTLASLVYSALSNPGASDAMLYSIPTVRTRFTGG